MSLNRSIGSTKYMMKRIPKNEKYEHIQTRLDTGCSLRKYNERLEEIKSNYKFRRDEIFKRLKVTTFAHMVLQVAAISDLEESENDAGLHIPGDAQSISSLDMECGSGRPSGSPLSLPLSDQDDATETTSCSSARSTLLSVISGTGELNLQHNNQKTTSEVVHVSDKPYPDCPYLLLDLRDEEKYNNCHITSAHSYPIAMLSRAMNPYTKDILAYKNVTGKIIIVYDEDEVVAVQAATVMCQRGFENLFLLSGGLKVIAQKFPYGLTTGSFPTSCLSSQSSSKGKKCPTSRKPLQAAEKRWRFTLDELAKIQEQLEETQLSSSCSSRRSSYRSSYGPSSRSSTSAWSLSSTSSAGKSSSNQSSKPWK